MLVKIKDVKVEICPALGIMLCNLVSFCDKYKLPLEIIDGKSDQFTFSTLGWTSQLIYKYQYHANRDYSDLAKISAPICTMGENSFTIIVSESVNIDKFN